MHETDTKTTRTGRYTRLATLSVLISSLGYLLLLLRWHGHTNWLESLYIIPGGFGTGMAQSALFISLQAVIADPAHMSPAVSFMYLSGTVWCVSYPTSPLSAFVCCFVSGPCFRTHVVYTPLFSPFSPLSHPLLPHFYIFASSPLLPLSAPLPNPHQH